MGFRKGLRKPDWLAELHAVLVVALVCFGAVVALGIASIPAGHPVHTDVPMGAVSGALAASQGLRPGAVLDGAGTVTVAVEKPSAGQVAAEMLTSLPTLLVIVTLLVVMFTVVRRARRGSPFDIRVVQRIRLLGVVALAGGVLATLIETIAEFQLTSTVVVDGVLTASVPFVDLGLWLLVGFGFLAVAEVVRRGLDLRNELETVI